jgi:hypothetical protein
MLGDNENVSRLDTVKVPSVGSIPSTPTNCSVCLKFQDMLERDPELEIERCLTCGHLYVPYTEDCACGYHG